ncbi:MAG: shikimate kinase [Deltaproteobacteria bacterium]|nr:shikimate kinase [Deltaproteobacteria bacterium]
MTPHPDKVPPHGCIVLIGMAASGKTTIGRELAALIGWARIDTDHLIESYYGARLQQITDAMSKEEFLDLEAGVILGLSVGNAVISTGGSVVYRQPAMDFLATLGPLVHIDVPLPIILERIARKPDRGLAIAPGQTIEDLYNERQALYSGAATVRFAGSEAPAAQLAKEIADWLCSPA